MKQLSSLIILISLLFSNTVTHADFFSEEIAGADPQVGVLQEIHLDSVSIKDSREIKRYNNTAYFIESIKTEAVARFEDGTIPLYRQYDIITNLDSFVYIMNQYFIYEQRYEKTRNNIYKESARSYLEDSK